MTKKKSTLTLLQFQIKYKNFNSFYENEKIHVNIILQSQVLGKPILTFVFALNI